jgi:hypothetical protein
MSEPARDYVIDARGRRKSVILPVRDYEKMLEDLHDLAIVAERREEPTLSFSDMLARLQENPRP